MSASARSGVKFPSMMPGVLDLAVDDGRRLDAVVEDDGEALADVPPRGVPELHGAGRVQEELDGGLVELVATDAGVLQVAPRDDRGPLEDVVDRRPRPCLGILAEALDDDEVGRDRPAVRGRGGLGGRIRPSLVVHELQLEEAGRPDDLLHAGRVVDSRELDQDPVRPLPADEGLGHAEGVDAVPDGLDGLAHRLVLDRHLSRRP